MGRDWGGGQHSRTLCPSQSPKESSVSRLRKDRRAVLTPKSGTTLPPAHPCSDIERGCFSLQSLGALVSLLGRGLGRGQVFLPLHGACLQQSLSKLSRPAGCNSEKTLTEKASRSFARSCSWWGSTTTPSSPECRYSDGRPSPPARHTRRARTLRIPGALGKLAPGQWRPPMPTRLPEAPALSPDTCSPRSGSAGSRSQRAASGPARRGVRNP